MFFVLLIFGLIFYFILWPIGKLMWRGYKLQQEWQKATAGMRGAYEDAARRRQEQKPHAKKKKIDPSVGEYVAFEEIKIETTRETHTSGDGRTSVRVESQIEDAVWEELN